MELKISSLLRLVIAILAASSLVAFSILEFEHPYFNSISLGLMLFFAGILYFFSGKFSSKYPPAIIVTLLLILFVQLRTAVLVVLPDSLLHSAKVTSEMFNVTLGYMIIGSVACYLGLALGYGNDGRFDLQSKTRNSFQDDFQLRFMAIAFVLTIILSMVIYYSLGYVGATGDGEHLGFFQRYIARFIYPIGWLMMFMATYALHSNKPSHIRLFGVLLGLYFLSFLLSGSRGGIYEIIILILSYKLIVEGDFMIRMSGWRLALLLGVVPVSLVGYWVATQLRAYWYGADQSIFTAFDTLLSSGDGILALENLVSDISHRLSFLEPTMCPIFFQELGLGDVSELVNIKTTVLSSINRLIPGKPLGDILFTEYAYGFIYEPQGGVLAYSESGRIDHVGYEWTIFGIAYQLLGFPAGIILIFGLTALLARIVQAFNKLGNFYGLSCSIFFMGILSVWIRNLGIDNLVDRTVHGFILLLVNFAGFWLARELRKVLTSEGHVIQ